MTENLKDSRRHDNRCLCRLAASIGTGCCLVLGISAFTGVFRGYSVQLPVPGWLTPVIMFLCIFYLLIKKSMPIFIYFFCSVVIVSLCIGILQGVYWLNGVVLYGQGRYHEAAVELEKTTQLWYLKLRPDYFEPSVMQKLAESYCQLEEYDKAIGVYELIVSRYPSVNREVASFRLHHLKDGLQFIARYNKEDKKIQNDFSKLYDIADIYESDLNCYTKALEIYTTITQMNISAEDKRDAYDAISRLTPSIKQ